MLVAQTGPISPGGLSSLTSPSWIMPSWVRGLRQNPNPGSFKLLFWPLECLWQFYRLPWPFCLGPLCWSLEQVLLENRVGVTLDGFCPFLKSLLESGSYLAAISSSHRLVEGLTVGCQSLVSSFLNGHRGCARQRSA